MGYTKHRAEAGKDDAFPFSPGYGDFLCRYIENPLPEIQRIFARAQKNAPERLQLLFLRRVAVDNCGKSDDAKKWSAERYMDTLESLAGRDPEAWFKTVKDDVSQKDKTGHLKDFLIGMFLDLVRQKAAQPEGLAGALEALDDAIFMDQHDDEIKVKKDDTRTALDIARVAQSPLTVKGTPLLRELFLKLKEEDEEAFINRLAGSMENARGSVRHEELMIELLEGLRGVSAGNRDLMLTIFDKSGGSAMDDNGWGYYNAASAPELQEKINEVVAEVKERDDLATVAVVPVGAPAVPQRI